MAARRIRDPEELERRKLARQRFRSLIRSVMYNRIWLNDAEDQQKISMNVKRNVAMLVRRKRKIGVLTMAEKGLIRTPHTLRTIEDRKILVKLITEMTCFSKLPPRICARLVPVIKFMYLSAGRKIIREGDFADTIYFILYGEVEASRQVFDPLKNEFKDQVEFIYGAGDCIGDIELIENCPRKHTYTATSIVEILVVFGHDFDDVLRVTMTQQWFEKKASISALGYFNHFSANQLISAYKLSVMREFDALETIYYEDQGEASSVYFVLSGECMILQCLQLKVTEFGHAKKFELVGISSDGKDIFSSLQKKPTAGKGGLIRSFDIDQDLDSDKEGDTELNRIKTALRNMDIKAIEISCGIRKSSKEKLLEIESEHSIETLKESKIEEMSVINEENVPFGYEAQELNSLEEYGSKILLLDEDDHVEENTDLDHVLEIATVNPAADNKQLERKEGGTENVSQHSIQSKRPTLKENNDNMAGSQEKIGNLNRTSDVESRASKTSESSSLEGRLSLNHKMEKQKDKVKFETRFIDVGTLSFGAIFGLGEKIEHRVIMARTKVQCLMLPRFWLFEKDQNPGKVWHRRRFVVDTSIPSRQQLFEDFLKTRKWQRFKNNLVQGCLDKDSIQNPTHIEDLPIMSHIL